MQTWLEALIYATTAVALVGTLVVLARDRPVGDPVYAALAVVEALLLLQLALGVSELVGTDADVASGLFVSYLVGIALVLPLGAFWSLAERSRAGTAVLVLALVTVLVLELRLQAIWEGGAGV